MDEDCRADPAGASCSDGYEMTVTSTCDGGGACDYSCCPPPGAVATRSVSRDWAEGVRVACKRPCIHTRKQGHMRYLQASTLGVCAHARRGLICCSLLVGILEVVAHPYIHLNLCTLSDNGSISVHMRRSHSGVRACVHATIASHIQYGIMTC